MCVVHVSLLVILCLDSFLLCRGFFCFVFLQKWNMALDLGCNVVMLEFPTQFFYIPPPHFCIMLMGKGFKRGYTHIWHILHHGANNTRSTLQSFPEKNLGTSSESFHLSNEKGGKNFGRHNPLLKQTDTHKLYTQSHKWQWTTTQHSRTDMGPEINKWCIFPVKTRKVPVIGLTVD